MSFVLAAYLSLVPVATQATDDEETTDPIESLVVQFLDQTLNAERFSKPHFMEYHMTIEYPDGTPPIYAEGAEYRHWASPPLYRYEALVGPYQPINQPAVRYEDVWNGDSEVSIRYDDKGRQGSVTISRGEPSSDLGRSNRYLSALGIPRTGREIEEASNGSYFLRKAVRARNGYTLESERQTCDGIECHVVRKGDLDVLWFSVSTPTRLVRRETWRNFGTPRREIVQCSEYGDKGVPGKIVWTKYTPVNDIGESSKIRSRETMFLDQLTFEEQPSNKFVADVEVGATVLDVDTLTSFRVEEPGKPPFDKALREAEAIGQPTGARNWIVELNLLFLAVACVFGAAIWWKRRCAKYGT